MFFDIANFKLIRDNQLIYRYNLNIFILNQIS